MSEFIIEYLIFFAKAFTVLVVLLIIIGSLFSKKSSNSPSSPKITFSPLNKLYQKEWQKVAHQVFSKSELKERKKQEKKSKPKK